MRFRRNVFLEKGVLDVAPLINVFFLLLIFFMLTSSFVFQPGIRVNLPKAVTSEVLPRDLVVVTITEGDKLYVGERSVDREDLMLRVKKAAREGKALLIKADKNAPLGTIIEVWDLCRQAGIKQVNIATT